MSAAAAPVPGGSAPIPRGPARLLLTWALVTAVGMVLVFVVLGPHMPPGTMSHEARDQREINTVLTALTVPVLAMVWLYFGYAIRTFRQRGEAVLDGPPIRGHNGIQLAWIIATSAIVIALAGWGTDELLGGAKGAGGGQGPSPLAVPAGAKHALQVQVIGQQWAWTFRYPGYGGVETAHLALPAHRLVELHVTSLDVDHSFWAIDLGVKADAIPGTDNVAFVTPERTGPFTIRCAELCGLWHGHMHDSGQVLSKAAFSTWIAQKVKANAATTKTLPPYAPTYFPDPLRRAS